MAATKSKRTSYASKSKSSGSKSITKEDIQEARKQKAGTGEFIPTDTNLATKAVREDAQAAKKATPTKGKSNDLADAVLAYLNLLDGPQGSTQDYDDAIAALVEALPASHKPQSLIQT